MEELENAERKLTELSDSMSFELWDRSRSLFENLYIKSSRWGPEMRRVTKKLLKKYYTTVIRRFMSSMKNNTRFIHICYNYAKMFKDPTELFEYFDNKGLGFHNQEAAKLRKQLIEKNQIKNNGQYISNEKTSDTTSNKGQSDTSSEMYYGPVSPELDRTYYKAVRMNNNQKKLDRSYKSPNDSSQYLQLEEVRLHDYFNKEYGIQRSKILQNEKVKIYKYLAHNKWIIQQMTSFLHFNQAVDVYYKENDKDDSYTTISTVQIPQLNPINICYVEYVDSIPMVQNVNDIIRFNTKYAQNVLQLQKILGNGGFGKVFKALLIQNNVQFTVAIKFYIRKKDIMTLQQEKPSISASYLRELYALAIVNYRALNCRYSFIEIIQDKFIKQNNNNYHLLNGQQSSSRIKPKILTGKNAQISNYESNTQTDDANYLENLDQQIPFTKLYCGLIGSKGNGAICLEYLEGENMFDLARRTVRTDPDLIIKYVIQMVKIVKYMHYLDVIHSDIKIDNWILISQESQTDCELKLIDFGKAIDLRLICIPDRVLRFDYRQLNAVSPAPAQKGGYLFDADINGIAASMYSLLFKNIMHQDDLLITEYSGSRTGIGSTNVIGSQTGVSGGAKLEEIKPQKAYLETKQVKELKQQFGTKAKMLIDLFQALLNRHHQGLPYAQEKAASLEFLTQIIKKYSNHGS